jgi:SAM-dependent methyltransferase
MMALDRHPRVARLIERGAQRALAAVGPNSAQAPEPPAPPEPELPREPEAPPEPDPIPTGPEPGAGARFARTHGVQWLGVEEFLATKRLYERLDEHDVSEIEELIRSDPELAGPYASVPDPGTRQHMVLGYGIWLGHSSATEKTGLRAAQPPEDVHVMARGPSAAAGGLYEADLVANALAGVGVDVAAAGDALDFGCSSGRVVRVMAAAYQAVRWHGCDPNAPAIDWASENLPGIDFFVSGDAPPLPLADGSLDLAYAISIWSHFSPRLGLQWFEEMRRVIRLGGHLVCTTHGLTSIAHYATHELRTVEQSEEIRDALYRSGHWYAPEFGEEGDWGVVNPDWGTAFLSPEWMLAKLCPAWRVLEFAPGRNQENQDVYVLQRV